MSQATDATQEYDAEAEIAAQAAQERFEQHAHASTLARTESSLQEVIRNSCKNRSAVEIAKSVEEQCTAIIGSTPWPFSVCWLCGFPVGEQTIQGKKPDEVPTMLQSIAFTMGITCIFVNRLSIRYDRETCEHVNPINIAGSAFLNKGPRGYEKKTTEKHPLKNHTLNIRMEYEGAHDFCNILKNEGYLMTLENGTITMSFKGLTIAKWQIDTWPEFLLDGSMNGPTLSSVICFERKGRMIFLKSPIHGYLLLKVLEPLNDGLRDIIFNSLHPTDELAAVMIVDNRIQVPNMPHAHTNNSTLQEENDKHVATYFKTYMTVHNPKPKKSRSSARSSAKSSARSTARSTAKSSAKSDAPRSYIYDIRNIASIHYDGPTLTIQSVDLTFAEYINWHVSSIIGNWTDAIKIGMNARIETFVTYIKETDEIVNELLWPLLIASTSQGDARYKGKLYSYVKLSELLDRRLDELYEDDSKRDVYDRIAVPVLTPQQRRNLHGQAAKILKLSPSKTAYKEKGQRAKTSQPVPGLPVCMSLDEYTQPAIFRFVELEKEKAKDVMLAYSGVSKSLYNRDFMDKLKVIVESGNFTSVANQLIKRSESRCIVPRQQSQNSRSLSPRRRSQNPRSLSPRRRSQNRSGSFHRNRRSGGYTRRLKK